MPNKQLELTPAEYPGILVGVHGKITIVRDHLRIMVWKVSARPKDLTTPQDFSSQLGIDFSSMNS